MEITIENPVDRYLKKVVDKFGWPKFGWKAHNSKLKSESKNIKTSFTDGYAKVAFAISYDDLPTVVVSDEVRNVMTASSLSEFNERVAYHRQRCVKDMLYKQQNESKKTSKAVATTPVKAPELIDKVANKLIVALDNDESKRLEELNKKKKLAKEKFNSFKWNIIGFGEAEEGTIGNYYFYFGPSKELEGKFFYKINGVRCKDSDNQNSLDDVKDRAFESFWLVVLAREKKSTKPEQLPLPAVN